VSYPVWVRPGTSDLAVFHQVFIEREYAVLHSLSPPLLVVDCGANVGYSASWFLSRWPSCRVVAIEPDPGNFAALARNLAPFAGRARALHAGVWSHPARLAIVAERYRDGGEWSRQVRECAPDEAAGVAGVDLGTILEQEQAPGISLLKMDVEGAEAVVFAANTGAWLARVDAIAIELHDDSRFGRASEVFFAAIAGMGFTVSRSGELTICRR
jgi:FkbM family methyltransferase